MYGAITPQGVGALRLSPTAETHTGRNTEIFPLGGAGGIFSEKGVPFNLFPAQQESPVQSTTTFQTDCLLTAQGFPARLVYTLLGYTLGKKGHISWENI